MSIRSLIFLAILTPTFSMAQVSDRLTEEEFLRVAVCKPFQDIQSYVTFRSPLEKARFLNTKSELQEFIMGSSQKIKAALEVNDYETAAISCAQIEDFTNNFQESCVDEEGHNILPPETIQICQCEVAVNPAENCQ